MVFLSSCLSAQPIAAVAGTKGIVGTVRIGWLVWPFEEVAQGSHKVGVDILPSLADTGQGTSVEPSGSTSAGSEEELGLEVGKAAVWA